MKKLISSLLATTLIITLFPTSVLAQEERETTATETSTVIESATDTVTNPDTTAIPETSADESGDEITSTETDSSDPLDVRLPEEEGTEEAVEAERDVQAPLTPYAGDIEPPLPPANPMPQTSFTADPKTFLQSFQGKGDVSLFSGALGYQFPLWVPQGRLGMTPQMSLSYTSTDSRYASPLGYGWSLPTNAIYRIPRNGYDKLYDQNEYFGADIFGSTSELMIFDEATGLYKPKHQTEGQDFWYNEQTNTWTLKDGSGNTYTFGSVDTTRQKNPDDPTQTYKWMLERVQDLNGNFMTLTYTKHENNIYPSTIRWTGHGNTQGLFEMRFVLEDRPAYTDYKTGFRVTHAKQIGQIDLYSYESGNAQLKLTYQLEYDNVNAAISLLKSIQVEAGQMALPGTEFQYFDGSEPTVDKKIHALKQINLPYGGRYEYTYQPASAYRLNDGTASNWIPFTTHTVKTQTVSAGGGEPEYTTNYDYRRGHYYFDELDAYKREYAGFGKVTVIDPEGNKQLLFFHQSEFDPENEADEALGEFSDHIGKKGSLYREESRSQNDVLMREVIRKWDRDILPQGDAPEQRGRIFLSREVSVTHGQGESKTSAMSFTSDAYGNPLLTTDHGEVTLLNPTGEFQDVGTDKRQQTSEFIQNANQHVFSALSRTTKTDQNNQLLGKTELDYDGLPWGQVSKGNWTKRRDWVNGPMTIEQSRTLNPKGLTIGVTNPRNFNTTLSYDTFDLYPATVTNAKAHVSQFEYDPFFGQALEVTDPNGHTQTQELDLFGRTDTRWTENAEGDLHLTDAFHYQMPADPVSITHTRLTGLSDANNDNIEVTQRTYFDGLGRVIQAKQEAEGDQFVSVSQRYDSRGQLEAATLPVFTQTLDFEVFNNNSPKTSYTYDSLGRVLTEETPVGTSSMSYGAWSQVVTDANGHEKEFESDAQGNLTKVTEHLGNQNFETNYHYNGNNQLLQITDAEGNETEMTYDLLGRRLSQTLLHAPNNQNPNSYAFTYDANGNLLTRTDAKGQVTTYIYDELDRPTSETAGGEVISFVYDENLNGLGRLTSVLGPNFNKWFTYDLPGRLTKETQKLETGFYETGFEYFGNGPELTGLIYPNQLAVHYRYNNAGQLEEVTDYAENFDYGPHGAVTQIDYANGVSTVNAYDPTEAYRMTGKTTTLGQSSYQNLSYEYDPVGNILEIVEAAPTVLARTATYAYDDLDRLTSATITAQPKPPLNLTFSYSPTGNILSKSDVGDYTYLDTHPQAVTQAGAENYGYDANGSLISRGTMTLIYNARGQLYQTNQDGKSFRYSYDESGRRFLKGSKTSMTSYISDLYEVTDNVPTAFVMAGGMKLATVKGGVTTFNHSDHLSGASVSTNENGQIVEQVDYLPYGSSRVELQEVGHENDYLFTGQENDEETGLYYYGARYYMPEVGRFTTVDPWGGDLTNPQTLNKYSYTLNNPLKYVDPSGRNPLAIPLAIEVGALIKAGAAAVAGVVSGMALKSVVIQSQAPEVTTIPAQPQESGTIIDTAPPVPSIEPLVTPVTPPSNPTIVDTVPPVASSDPLVNTGGCGVNMSCESASGCGEVMSCAVPDDIGNTLDRIANGQSYPHPNDGTIFQNREGLLPPQSEGYYKEYVHPTPGIDHAGAQRVVTGENGEQYYSPDHYESFEEIE